MKTIQLSSKSFWVKLWSFLTMGEESLPANTCDFKADVMLYTLLNILFLPMLLLIRIVAAIVGAITGDGGNIGKAGPVIGSALQGFGYLIGIGAELNPNIFISIAIGSGIVVGAITVIVLIVIAGLYINEYFERNPVHVPTPKPVSFVKEVYQSAKEKYCAKIEYK